VCGVQTDSFKIIAPALGLPSHSDAETLGAVTWLWMHSQRHRELPLIALSQSLLPPLKAQQFILVSDARSTVAVRPVAYVAWANLSAEAEGRYLRSGATAMLRAEDWTGGERMWLTDIVAPFGHTHQFCKLITRLLPDSCWRALYHRSDERGQRIKVMRGANVSPIDADSWWRTRPLSTVSASA
jgi:cytolysin-activating lysine-acyltransferase